MKLRLPSWTLLIALALPAIGCVSPVGTNLPPAERLMEPGPGVGGPGPGVLAPIPQPGPMMGMPATQPTVQVLFGRPESLQVRWDVGGYGQFDSTPLVVPGRHNFPQGAIYRLKLTNIAGREGIELYPTLEVANTTPRTAAYLAHNAIPVAFTEEDFEQVLAGNFVTKVIYLPDPEFQVLALAGVETLVSTRLDPGVDPIVEADRRGSIMAVVRLGNKDVELPGAEGEMELASFAMAGGGMMGGMNGGMHGGMHGGVVGAACCPPGGGLGGVAGMGHVPGMPPQFVAGVTAPQYGMPQSGTPIGLAGPPHIPLGGPAGLQRHVMRNHTHMHIPEPNKNMIIDVKQRPGMSYPTPPSHVHIREQSFSPTHLNVAPHHTKSSKVK
jgi:hypothetical protein